MHRVTRDADRESAPILPRQRGPAPTAELIPAGEALTWIAFGETKTRKRHDVEMLYRWGHPPVDLFVALSARLAKWPWAGNGIVGFFTPLEGAFENPGLVEEFVGERWANTMRSIRARARQREGRLVSFADLWERLGGELGALKHDVDLLTAAEIALRGVLAVAHAGTCPDEEAISAELAAPKSQTPLRGAEGNDASSSRPPRPNPVGRPSTRKDAAIDEMVRRVNSQIMTLDALVKLPIKELPEKFPNMGKQTMLNQARWQAIEKLRTIPRIPAKR